MERKLMELNDHDFILITGTLVMLTFVANIFYGWCWMVPPRNRQSLKQPLKALLAVPIWCNITYCIYWIVMISLRNKSISADLNFSSWLILIFNAHNSMAAYVWLNFFYYTQIVPAQHPLSIWVKRNIKLVIYTLLFFSGIFFLFVSVLRIDDYVRFVSLNSVCLNTTQTGHFRGGSCFLSDLSFIILNIHILVCLCMMAYCSFCTVRYLYGHMRRMGKSGNSFSSARLRSQMQVTITGIFQGVYYFLFYTLYLYDSFLYMYSSDFYFGLTIEFTVTTVSVSGLTLNLGIGQVIFRQRIISVWKDLKAMCTM